MNNETPEKLDTTELPAPGINPDHQLAEHGLDTQPRTELAGAQAAELPQVGGSAPVAQEPTQKIPSMPSPPGAVSAPPTVAAGSNTPVVADDNDLIEKEWVQKAKSIVARTKDDPYQQNKEINNYKADYMKKRFNKDIRISEG